MEDKKVKTFEDLKAYQIIREFRRKVERLINKFQVEDKVSLISQMRKAKLSVTNSIAGQYGGCHSKNICNSTGSQEGLSLNFIDNFNELFCNGCLNEGEYNEFKKDAHELREILNAYIAKTKMEEDYL